MGTHYLWGYMNSCERTNNSHRLVLIQNVWREYLEENLSSVLIPSNVRKVVVMSNTAHRLKVKVLNVSVDQTGRGARLPDCPSKSSFLRNMTEGIPSHSMILFPSFRFPVLAETSSLRLVTQKKFTTCHVLFLSLISNYH